MRERMNYLAKPRSLGVPASAGLAILSQAPAREAAKQDRAPQPARQEPEILTSRPARLSQTLIAVIAVATSGG